MEVLTDPAVASANPTSTPADMDYLSYLFYRALGSKQQAPQSPPPPSGPSPPTTPTTPTSPGKRSPRKASRSKRQAKQPPAQSRCKQPYEAFLVFDVEATCIQNVDFNWCNEIIEWPVALLRWADKTNDGKASCLLKVDEFRTYVRPTYRPVLSSFCKELTGISQPSVDSAPTFAEVLPRFKMWLVKHGLICGRTERRLQQFLWCTDGPFDIRDFVVKQCFISKLKMPHWMHHDVMDVRKVVLNWMLASESTAQQRNIYPASRQSHNGLMKLNPTHFRRPSLNIASQLEALALSPFEGRQHSGIDDTRNIARIVTELARLGVRLETNINIDPGKRFYWMGGQPGEIWEERL